MPLPAAEPSMGGPHRRTRLPGHDLLPQPPVKKKRKQNQACDTCKARRVKCDLADLPPDSSCSKCLDKGIRCTSIYNQSRPPPKRTGVRIEEAKARHGTFSSGDDLARQCSQIGGEFLPLEAYISGSRSSSPSASALSVREWKPNRLPALPDRNQASGILPHFALVQAFERDLLHTYFISAHLAVKSVDPEHFRSIYYAASENSSFMSPLDQVLAAAMVAWGARFSNNPLVLPPSAVYDDNAGRIREATCQSLLDRALALMDSSSLLRKPGRQSITALILISPLVEYSAEIRGDSNPVAAEAHVLRGIMTEHVESLDLWAEAEQHWEDSGLSRQDTWVNLPGERYITLMKAQRLLWVSWIWDAFLSCGSRKPPRFADDALQHICPILPRFGDPLPDTSQANAAQRFLLLISAYPLLGGHLRLASRRLIVPHADRRQQLSLDEMESACEEIWDNLSEFGEWLSELSPVLGMSPTLSTFSPVTWYLSVRLGLALAWMMCQIVVHERFLSERMKANKGNPSATLHRFNDPSPDATPSSEGNGPLSDMDRWGTLDTISYERSLAAARDVAKDISSTLPNKHFLRSSGTEFREIRVIAEFLAEVPVQEQGACWREPSSSDWTWQAKTLEVSLLMESIKRVGWAWDMNQGGHESVRQIMIKNTPPGFPPFSPLQFDLSESSAASDPYSLERDLISLLQKGRMRNSLAARIPNSSLSTLSTISHAGNSGSQYLGRGERPQSSGVATFAQSQGTGQPGMHSRFFDRSSESTRPSSSAESISSSSTSFSFSSQGCHPIKTTSTEADPPTSFLRDLISRRYEDIRTLEDLMAASSVADDRSPPPSEAKATFGSPSISVAEGEKTRPTEPSYPPQSLSLHQSPYPLPQSVFDGVDHPSDSAGPYTPYWSGRDLSGLSGSGLPDNDGGKGQDPISATSTSRVMNDGGFGSVPTLGMAATLSGQPVYSHDLLPPQPFPPYSDQRYSFEGSHHPDAEVLHQLLQQQQPGGSGGSEVSLGSGGVGGVTMTEADFAREMDHFLAGLNSTTEDGSEFMPPTVFQ